MDQNFLNLVGVGLKIKTIVIYDPKYPEILILKTIWPGQKMPVQIFNPLLFPTLSLFYFSSLLEYLSYLFWRASNGSATTNVCLGINQFQSHHLPRSLVVNWILSKITYKKPKRLDPTKRWDTGLFFLCLLWEPVGIFYGTELVFL